MRRTWAPDVVDGTLGVIASVAGLLVLLCTAPHALAVASVFAWWWNLLGLAWATVLCLLALLGRLLPLRVLRPVWAAHCLVFLLLLASAYAAVRDAATARPPALPEPWVWAAAMTPAVFLMLLVPRWMALTGAALMAILPAASALLFVRALPDIVRDLTPLCVGIGIAVVICSAARTLLAGAHRAQLTARLREALDHRGHLAAIQGGEFARTVHDHVLGTLLAVSRSEGAPSPVQRQEARRALALLETTPETLPPLLLGTETVAVLVEAETRRLAPDAVIGMSTRPGSISSAVVSPVLKAFGEAVRNAVAHSGSNAPIRVRIHAGPDLSLRVTDTGGGFDPSAAGQGRFGVRESILNRMREVESGSARIRSDRSGTTVEIDWAP